MTGATVAMGTGKLKTYPSYFDVRLFCHLRCAYKEQQILAEWLRQRCSKRNKACLGGYQNTHRAAGVTSYPTRCTKVIGRQMLYLLGRLRQRRAVVICSLFEMEKRLHQWHSGRKDCDELFQCHRLQTLVLALRESSLHTGYLDARSSTCLT